MNGKVDGVQENDILIGKNSGLFPSGCFIIQQQKQKISQNI